MSTQQTNTAAQSQDEPRIRRGRTGALLARWGLSGEWLVTAALIYIGFILFVAVFGFLFQPYPHTQMDLFNQLQPPVFMQGGSWEHIFGTDELGRDVLSRLIRGLRLSVLIGVIGTVIGAVLGSFLGIVAAHFRGWVEEVLMMLVDVQVSLPFIIFALAVLAFVGNSLTILIIVVGIDGWERYARLARSMVLTANQQDYVLAVRSLGLGNFRIYQRHVLPNIMGTLIVQATINLPGVILLESTLSFLGLGVQPPMTSLGQILGVGRDYLILAPWIAVLPGMVIFFLTLSIATVGDWLRDRLDPTLK
ncbi:ABC transporter permease [Candidatus Halocynthiibacter alkanivorans]|uniref:ABC transporter permease n=1 Tax=Candidatus Halocynthiibacter alkanivorans TaxID=2267619 RepID=UPI001F1A819A|nr:ABC transporter permease [Candidatus Halocynthiibacter alkanivorans]